MRLCATGSIERLFIFSFAPSFNQRNHRREMHKVEDVRLVEGSAGTTRLIAPTFDLSTRLIFFGGFFLR